MQKRERGDPLGVFIHLDLASKREGGKEKMHVVWAVCVAVAAPPFRFPSDDEGREKVKKEQPWREGEIFFLAGGRSRIWDGNGGNVSLGKLGTSGRGRRNRRGKEAHRERERERERAGEFLNGEL